MRTTNGLLFVLLTTGASAQSWCPPGATWHHGFYEGNSGILGYVNTLYAGDTVVGGSTCQRLEATLHAYAQQSQNYFDQHFTSSITRGQGAFVELWNGTAFDTLFNFAAVPGDGWYLPLDNYGPLTVLDTGHASIDGQSLRFLVVGLGEFSTGPHQDTIFERLGFLSYYLDGSNAYLFDTGNDPLRCYSDNTLNYTAVNAQACDFILSAWEAVAARHTSLWPSPTQGALWLDLGQAVKGVRYRILDEAGRQVMGGALNSGSATSRLDVSALDPGLYTLRYEAPSEPAWTTRFIKE